MSQAGIASISKSGGGGIQTTNGDTGSITGSTVTIYAANNIVPNISLSGSTVKFVNSGTVSTLYLTDGANMLQGTSAGNATLTGNANNGYGASVLHALTNGARSNVFGASSGQLLTTGSDNSIFGNAVGATLLTGSFNLLLGYASGGTYTSSESSNILLENAGILGESNVIRVGTQGSGSGQQNTCYIAGIVGVTTSNSQLVTINSSTGQLGVATGVVGTWTDVTSATQTLAVGNGYITDRGGGVTYTLPATATQGDVIEIWGKAGLATITPNANQQILIGALSGSIGPGGTATSTNAGDIIILRCLTGGASSVWRGLTNGNWTLI